MAPQFKSIVDTFVDIATTDKGLSVEDLSLRALLVCCDTARLANGVLVEMAANGDSFEVTSTREDLARLFEDDGSLVPSVWRAIERGVYGAETLDASSVRTDEAKVLKLIGATRLLYFPIHQHGRVTGVLILTDRSTIERDHEFVTYIQGVADVAVAIVDSERRAARALEMVGQLSEALESRVLIEQAKGVIAERYSMNTPQAFGWLRSLARNERGKLRDVAQRIVSSTDTRPSTNGHVDSSVIVNHREQSSASKLVNNA